MSNLFHPSQSNPTIIVRNHNRFARILVGIANWARKAAVKADQAFWGHTTKISKMDTTRFVGIL